MRCVETTEKENEITIIINETNGPSTNARESGRGGKVVGARLGADACRLYPQCGRTDATFPRRQMSISTHTRSCVDRHEREGEKVLCRTENRGRAKTYPFVAQRDAPETVVLHFLLRMAQPQPYSSVTRSVQTHTLSCPAGRKRFFVCNLESRRERARRTACVTDRQTDLPFPTGPLSVPADLHLRDMATIEP